MGEAWELHERREWEKPGKLSGWMGFATSGEAEASPVFSKSDCLDRSTASQTCPCPPSTELGLVSKAVNEAGIVREGAERSIRF